MYHRVIGCCLFITLIGFLPRVEAGHYELVTFEFPPLEYTGKDGKLQGAAVEIITEAFESAGHSVTIRSFPWTRSLRMVKNGEVDAIFTAYKNPEREKFLDYSQQVLIPQIVGFFARKESHLIFNGNLDQLSTVEIGTVSTISYGQKFDKVKSKLKLQRANTLQRNFERLIRGRLDLVISNIYVADHTLRQMGLKNEVKPLFPRIQSVPSYIAFTKKKPLVELRQQIDNQLLKMKQGGRYQAIMDKYGGQKAPLSP
ncbi:substrate-binding periplasmic protein [Dongshaea marina]|uniref:substrate-binding periplasmic protein n=1 Tax=Dongshaea marina TaxID=2047966 RepID=UPI000D3ED01E|nr:transporter substrate-binding domain-containing protein [Dongshaea marina]